MTLARASVRKHIVLVIECLALVVIVRLLYAAGSLIFAMVSERLGTIMAYIIVYVWMLLLVAMVSDRD